MKLTVEKATDLLPFLNVEIKFDKFNFKTSVWRKPTYAGLLLNFRSTCPNARKSGLITCLLKFAKIICFDCELFKDEITKLRCIFAKKCYPNWFFNKCLKKFEKKIPKQNHKIKKLMIMRTYLACRILENHLVNLHPNCLPY